MLHASPYHSLQQGMRLERVGHVVAERIDDGVRNHDLGGEVQDRADLMLPDQPRYQLRIGDVADEKERRAEWPPAFRSTDRPTPPASRRDREERGPYGRR